MTTSPRTVVGFSAFRRLLERPFRQKGGRWRLSRGAMVRLFEATEDLVRDVVRQAVRDARQEGLKTLRSKHLEAALRHYNQGQHHHRRRS